MHLTDEDAAALADRADRAYYAAVRPARLDRVDPLKMASVLGYRTEFHRLSRDGSVCGLIAPGGGRIPVYDRGWREDIRADGQLILLERALRLDPALKGVLHFTAAHELAHGLMAGQLPAGGGVNDVLQAGPERLADRMAARLLMPERLVWPCLAHFGLPKHIDSLCDEFGRQCNFEWKFGKMAQHLQVSRQALSIRLHAMGILRRQPPVGHRVRDVNMNERYALNEWNVFPGEGEWE